MKIIIFLLILLIIISGCEISEQPKPKKELLELQIEACTTADTAGTCDSRLTEVGIVLKEECCEVLGKCC